MSCYYIVVSRKGDREKECDINTGRALSVGGEDVRPSRDVQSLLILESHEFIRGSMSNTNTCKEEHTWLC